MPLNLRHLISILLLSFGVFIPLPIAFSQQVVNYETVIVFVVIVVLAWFILLYPKGGWFNYSPLIDPMIDRNRRLFLGLLVSCGIALEWTPFLVSVLQKITPNFLLPEYFGPFPNPLAYVRGYVPQNISPGILFLIVFVLFYLFVSPGIRSGKSCAMNLASLFILAGFIPLILYILSNTEYMGVIPSIFTTVLFVIVTFGVPYYFRIKRLASWLLTVEMFIYIVAGFALLFQFEQNVLPTGEVLSANILALSLGITLAHFEDVCGQEHHIIESFSSLGKLRTLGSLIVPISLLGVFYTAYVLTQYGSIQFTKFSLPASLEFFGTSTNIQLPFFFFFIILVWGYVVLLGNRVSQAISYGTLIIFFFYGIFSVSSQSVTGLWNLDKQGSIFLSLVSLVVFYEPLYNFITSNYVRLSEKLSINYWLSRSKLLHARYRPVKDIGMGGFARVVKVFDLRSRKELALKQAIVKYDNSSLPSAEQIKIDIDNSISKLNFEYTVLSNCHFPLIVAATDHFQEGVNSEISYNKEKIYMLNQFMVEEFVDGVTLEELVSYGSKFKEDIIKHYLKRILLALNYLHQHEILHRDLTPGNIMVVGATNDIKIIDLGLAKKTREVGFATKSSGFFGTGQTGVVGTQGYYAPELLTALDTGTGIVVNEQYDVYSVGAIGFFLATMEQPPDLQQLLKRSKNPGVELDKILDSKITQAGMSPQLSGIIRKAMALDPKNRYSSAFEFYAALSNLKGMFVVTDVGEIFQLDQTLEYDIEYKRYKVDRNGIYDFEPNIGKVSTGRTIYVRTSKSDGILGKISYDGGQKTFRLVPSQGSRYYTSPRSIQAKPIEHNGPFFLRNGLNNFITYKSVGIIPFLSRNYIPDGAFRYYEVS